jgi:hypothetical protein
MKKNKDPFERIFDGLQVNTQPTNEQKTRILNQILIVSRFREMTFWEKVERWIFDYPWRFAFGFSTIQAVVCTLLFGTDYTNLLFSFWGG